jgi:hypothetical protein
VIGAVLLVVILGLNAYLFSFGIALNGMKVWFPIFIVLIYPSILGLIGEEASIWIGADITGTYVFPSILIGSAFLPFLSLAGM